MLSCLVISRLTARMLQARLQKYLWWERTLKIVCAVGADEQFQFTPWGALSQQQYNLYYSVINH